MDIRGKVAIVGIGHTEQGEIPGQSPELLSVRAVAMPILLSAPRSQVVAVTLFDLWFNGQITELAALGIVWTTFMMGIGALFYLMSKRYGLSVQ